MVRLERLLTKIWIEWIECRPMVLWSSQSSKIHLGWHGAEELRLLITCHGEVSLCHSLRRNFMCLIINMTTGV